MTDNGFTDTSSPPTPREPVRCMRCKEMTESPVDLIVAREGEVPSPATGELAGKLCQACGKSLVLKLFGLRG